MAFTMCVCVRACVRVCVRGEWVSNIGFKSSSTPELKLVLKEIMYWLCAWREVLGLKHRLIYILLSVLFGSAKTCFEFLAVMNLVFCLIELATTLTTAIMLNDRDNHYPGHKSYMHRDVAALVVFIAHILSAVYIFLPIKTFSLSCSFT